MMPQNSSFGRAGDTNNSTLLHLELIPVCAVFFHLHFWDWHAKVLCAELCSNNGRALEGSKK